jgi:hypothetical protein
MGLIIKNGIKYFGDNTVELTQAQYDALSQAEKLNGTTYYITDGQNITTASAVSYNNTTSGLTATNVQSAIDSIIKDLLKDYVKVKYVDVGCPSLTQGMHLSVNIDDGYKFLCWQSVGSSIGWVTSFPIYIANCFSTTGGVYWNGTLPTDDNRRVQFWYYEVKNI